MSLFPSPPVLFPLKQKGCVWTPASPWQGEVHPRLTATILPSPSDRGNPHSWNQSYLGGVPQLQACSQHQEPPRPIWDWRWGQILDSGNQQGGDVQRAATEDTRQEKEKQAWKTQGAGKEEAANSIGLAELGRGWVLAGRGPPVWHLRDIAGAQFTVTGSPGAPALLRAPRWGVELLFCFGLHIPRISSLSVPPSMAPQFKSLQNQDGSGYGLP